MPLRCAVSLLALVSLLGTGCTLVPQKYYEPQYHNPWPQLRAVAVAPFYNLSQNPTVNQDEFANAYFNELQAIPGFEVVPVGVTRQAMKMYGIHGNSEEDFQRLAQMMEVDAIVVGTVNEFTPYYPPRMALTVRWYAANPCFHAMPNGYGLPWGRAEEEYIPDSLVAASEFELATAQLATQTPVPPLAQQPNAPTSFGAKTSGQAVAHRQQPAEEDPFSAPPQTPRPLAESIPPGEATEISPAPAGTGAGAPATIANMPAQGGLPANWPDPRGFIPPAPAPFCPQCMPQTGPVLTHTHSYNGNDSDFTEALSSYYEFRDEARFGGWRAYLQRSDDFIRFCCYMHITQMLAARGGAGETKVVYRWPISRYER